MNSLSFFHHHSRWCVTLYVAIFVIGLMASSLAFGIRFTWTASLPPGLYRTVDEPIRRGALVAVCLPEPLAIATRKRGYGHPGFCSGGIAPLLKKVAAIPGDTVQVSANGLSVNDLPITRTQRRQRDSKGREIQMIEEGIYTVEEGELWMISNYRTRSWDSRYFGPIPVDSVKAVMVPLLTWSK